MNTLTQANRIDWLDHLRTFMIFLVVLGHAGGVYESSGTWAGFWIVDDPAVNNMSGLLFLVLDIFMMPTLFFISGFCAAGSRQDKTRWAFLKAKLKRLIVPWMIAVLTLIPLYKVIFLYARHLPQEPWTTCFHWSNGIWGQNWLWFLPVLFGFNGLYLLLAGIRRPRLSLRSVLGGALVVGFVYSLGMDLAGLRGWTKTALLDFQNERLLIYFLAFLLGAYCYGHRVFERPQGRRLYTVVNSIAWVPVTTYLFFLLYPWFKPGHYVISEFIHRSILWLSFQVSVFSLVYLVIETFRRYINKPGKLRNELNRVSYYVYIIHVIVLGSLALLLLPTAIPSLGKHLILAVSTFGMSSLIVYGCRRIVMRYRPGMGLTVDSTPTSQGLAAVPMGGSVNHE